MRKYDQERDDEGQPMSLICEHCFEPMESEQACQVPMDGKPGNVIYCCVDCYDEVCDEEGYDAEI